MHKLWKMWGDVCHIAGEVADGLSRLEKVEQSVQAVQVNIDNRQVTVEAVDYSAVLRGDMGGDARANLARWLWNRPGACPVCGRGDNIVEGEVVEQRGD